ncbi:hypothetical protein [Embleya sp. NBC_00896]|uniref:hypothetical protein n=1 Tax=Embleya sp. NBC_00896 TaxID=2975961 RepID=UPI002F908B21|nr:hypothetical protein OG928_34100 [Embleya sp. NBC_00896]
MAIPLIVVAVVCLLATSSAWLFSGNNDARQPNGLNRSTPPSPHASSSRGQVPDTTEVPSGAPTLGPGTSRTPTAPASTARPPSDSAGPQATGPGPIADPSHNNQASPPGTAPTPVSTPAGGTRPGDISVFVDRGATTGYIDLVNPTERPLASWTLTITVAGSRFIQFRAEGNDGFTTDVGTTTAKAISNRPLLPHEELTVYFELKAPTSGGSCNFSGVSCRF